MIVPWVFISPLPFPCCFFSIDSMLTFLSHKIYFSQAFSILFLLATNALSLWPIDEMSSNPSYHSLDLLLWHLPMNTISFPSITPHRLEIQRSLHIFDFLYIFSCRKAVSNTPTLLRILEHSSLPLLKSKCMLTVGCPLWFLTSWQLTLSPPHPWALSGHWIFWTFASEVVDAEKWGWQDH